MNQSNSSESFLKSKSIINLLHKKSIMNFRFKIKSNNNLIFQQFFAIFVYSKNSILLYFIIPFFLEVYSVKLNLQIQITDLMNNFKYSSQMHVISNIIITWSKSVQKYIKHLIITNYTSFYDININFFHFSH